MLYLLCKTTSPVTEEEAPFPNTQMALNISKFGHAGPKTKTAVLAGASCNLEPSLLAVLFTNLRLP
jgi:hypothetical protein